VTEASREREKAREREREREREEEEEEEEGEYNDPVRNGDDKRHQGRKNRSISGQFQTRIVTHAHKRARRSIPGIVRGEREREREGGWEGGRERGREGSRSRSWKTSVAGLKEEVPERRCGT